MWKIPAAAFLVALAVQTQAQTLPTITTQPLSQSALAGASPTFTVAVSGTGPFLYQWRLNGTNLQRNLQNGLITTAAGVGEANFSGDGGLAIDAGIHYPSGVALDANGNLYLSDNGNQRIRMVDRNGLISTFAGNGIAGFSGDGAPATEAKLSAPVGLAFDAKGNLYISDTGNQRIRKVDTNRFISTVAGNGTPGYFGDGVAAIGSSLGSPYGVAVDVLGNIFIADSLNNRVRKVGTNGIITTVAGNGHIGYNANGSAATNGPLSDPTGVAIDRLGNLLIVERGNDRVVKVDTNGILTTEAGKPGVYGDSGDGGYATNATLADPFAVAVAADGTLYIAQYGDGVVRTVSPSGIISTFAGNGVAGYSGDGGSPPLARLNKPVGLCLDSNGDYLFIADQFNNRVRRAFESGAPSLTVTNATAGGAGNYDVIVTSSYGSVTSSVATLTLLAIASPPTNQDVVLGGNATFSVAAIGTPPLAYEWYFNGHRLTDGGGITGSATSILNLDHVALTDAGDYDVAVTNLLGSVTSSPAVLTVGSPTVISDLPSGIEVLAGGNALFAPVVTGVGPFSYQWQCNGTNLPNLITSVAGNGSVPYVGTVSEIVYFAGDGGPATASRLYNPSGVAADAAGNWYISDNSNQRIRLVNTNGIISTIAGTGSAGYSGDGAAAANAGLNYPVGLALDGHGGLFIADANNNRIRMIDPAGIITTVAGNGTGGDSGDGGLATSAALKTPYGVAVDSSGNLFIADTGNNCIRRVGTNGIITTVAGNGGAAHSGDGGAATSASLNTPAGVAVDNAGSLFIADYANHCVRKVSPGGIITTIAGTGNAGYSGDGGPATNATMKCPFGVVAAADGTLYIAEYYNHVVRKISPLGIISTLAGTGNIGFYGDGGAATNAELFQPTGLALNSPGNVLLVADQFNNCIRAVELTTMSALALENVSTNMTGNYSVVVSNRYGPVASGTASLTVLLPPAIIQQPANQVLVAGANAVFNVALTGTLPLSYQWYFDGKPLVGQTTSILALSGIGPSEVGSYQVVITNLYGSVTSRVATLAAGNPPVITTQPGSRTVLPGANVTLTVAASGDGPLAYQWRLNGLNISCGTITTIAGDGTAGYSGDGGAATNASLSSPGNIAMDGVGNLFIADTGNQVIRKVDTNGVITTVAGNGIAGYSGDGGQATNASLNHPTSVAVDGAGNLFIADAYNGLVRKLATNGTITTVAGGGTAYPGNGLPATAAALNYPTGVAVDIFSNLFIADQRNNLIRKVGPDGIMNTVAGTGGGLSNPFSMAVDDFGNLLIADTYDYLILEMRADSVIDTFAGLFQLYGGAGMTHEPIGGYFGDGGPATNAAVNYAISVAMAGSNVVFIADDGNNCVRRVDSQGIITTYAGAGPNLPGYTGDGGNPADARLRNPAGVAVNGAGDLFIADTGNNRIRKVVTGPSLVLRNVGRTNTGNYDLVVTSPFGSVTSNVVNLTVVLPALNAKIVAGPGVQLQFQGVPGNSYILLSANSLAPPASWTPVITNAADVNGYWTFTDTNDVTSAARFYRLSQ